MKSKLNLFILLLTLVISDSTLAQTKGDYVVQGRVPDAVLVNDNDDNEDVTITVPQTPEASRLWLNFFQGNGQLESFNALVEWETIDDTAIVSNLGIKSSTNDENEVAVPQGNLGIKSIYNLDFSDNELRNVDFLVSLTNIRGDIDFRNNNISNLNGMYFVQSINGNAYFDNNQINSINNLLNLTTIGGELTLYNNPNLTRLYGLKSITSGTLRLDDPVQYTQKVDFYSDFCQTFDDGNITVYLRDTDTQLVKSDLCKADPWLTFFQENGQLSLFNQMIEWEGENDFTTANVSGLGVNNFDLPSGNLGVNSLYRLDFSNNELTTLHFMENVTEIRDSLIVNDNFLRDVNKLSGVITVDGDINLANNSLRRLDGLENITEIDRLFINGNPLTELTPIKNLFNVNDIYIDEPSQYTKIDFSTPLCNSFINGVADFIVQSTGLSAEVSDICANTPEFSEWLDYFNSKGQLTDFNSIFDWITFDDFADLSNQNIEYTEFVDLPTTIGVYSIFGLDMSQNKLRLVDFLGSVREVRTNLYLQLNDLRNVVGLSQLESVVLLDISKNTNLQDIRGLANLSQAERIIFDNPSQYNLKPDYTSNFCQALVSGSIQATNIGGDKLSALNLCSNIPDDEQWLLFFKANNQFTTYDNLSAWQSADETVRINKNYKNSDLPSVEIPQTSIYSLLLNDNLLSNIDFLSKIITIRGDLNLTNNLLENINGLLSVSEAGNIDLSDNDLESLSGFNVKKLNILDISNNSGLINISALESIEEADRIIIDNTAQYLTKPNINSQFCKSVEAGSIIVSQNSSDRTISVSDICSGSSTPNDAWLYFFNKNEQLLNIESLSDWTSTESVVDLTFESFDNTKVPQSEMNIDSLYTLDFSNNEFTNFDFLKNIKHVEGDLLLNNNYSTNTNAFINLEYVNGKLDLSNNSIKVRGFKDGLDNLKYVKEISIYNNPYVETIEGLRNIAGNTKEDPTIIRLDPTEMYNSNHVYNRKQCCMTEPERRLLPKLSFYDPLCYGLLTGRSIAYVKETTKKANLSIICEGVPDDALWLEFFKDNNQLLSFSLLNEWETTNEIANVNGLNLSNSDIPSASMGIDSIYSLDFSNNNLTDIKFMAFTETVRGDLNFSNNSITTLEGLNLLKTVTGELKVYGNNYQTLLPLKNITSTSAIRIDNPSEFEKLSYSRPICQAIDNGTVTVYIEEETTPLPLSRICYTADTDPNTAWLNFFKANGQLTSFIDLADWESSVGLAEVSNLNLSNADIPSGLMRINSLDSLDFSGNNLANSFFLTNINRVRGELNLSNNNLANISSLSNISTADIIKVNGNDNVTSLIPLSNLMSANELSLDDITQYTTKPDASTVLCQAIKNLQVKAYDINRKLSIKDICLNVSDDDLWLNFFKAEHNTLLGLNDLQNWKLKSESAEILTAKGLENSDLPSVNINVDSIYTLKITNQALTNIDFMQGVNEIREELNFNNNELISISGLSNINGKVNKLVLSNNLLTNVSSLSGVTFNDIDLSNNQITDTTGLDFNEVDNLLLNNNNLENVNGLSNLTRVNNELTLFSNLQLTDITGLSNLSSGTVKIDDPTQYTIKPDFSTPFCQAILSNELTVENNLTSKRVYVEDVCINVSEQGLWLSFFHKKNQLLKLGNINEWLNEEEEALVPNNNYSNADLPAGNIGVSSIYTLDMSSNNLTSIEFLSGLEKVRGDLKLNNNSLLSIGELVDLQYVTGKLDLSNTDTVNVSPLLELREVGTLDLSNNNNLLNLSGLENIEKALAVYLNEPVQYELIDFTSSFCFGVSRGEVVPIVKSTGRKIYITEICNGVPNDAKWLNYMHTQNQLLGFTDMSDWENKDVLADLSSKSLTVVDIPSARMPTTQLYSLNFSNNLLSNINFLNLIEVVREELNFNNNAITNISGLGRLREAKTIILSNNDIDSLDRMEAIETIKYLNVSYNPNLDDISVLRNISGILELRMNNTSIPTLVPIENFTSMTYLDISNTPLTDISPLANLTPDTVIMKNPLELLVKPDFSSPFCQAYYNETIEVTYNGASVYFVDICSNVPAHVAWLDFFNKENQLTNFDTFDQWLSANTVANVSARSLVNGRLPQQTFELDSIYELDMSINNIENVSFLNGVDTVRRNLYLQNNQIVDFTGLDTLEVVNDLNVSNNNMIEFVPQSLTSVNNLEISNNNFIETISLPSLSTLTGDLTIENNPLLTTLENPLLTSIGGDVSITNTSLTNMNINGIDFQGALSIENNTGLTNFIQDSIGSVNLDYKLNNNAFTEATIGSIGSLNRSLIITNNNGLEDIRINTLPKLGRHLQVTDNPSLLNIYIDDIQSQGSAYDFILRNNNSLKNIEVNNYNIGSTFEVYQNPSVESIIINNLTNVGGHVYMQKMPSLKTINIGKIDSVGLDIHAADNPLLTDFNVTDSLGTIGRTLSIKNNPILTNLNIGNSLRVNTDLLFTNNPNLIDITGLANLSYVGRNFAIDEPTQYTILPDYNTPFCIGITASDIIPEYNNDFVSITNLCNNIPNHALWMDIFHSYNQMRDADTIFDWELSTNTSKVNLSGKSLSENNFPAFPIDATKLYMFNISNNNFTQLDILSNLTEVRESFYAQNNLINDISNITQITRIENNFDLSNNRLISLDGFSNLTYVGNEISMHTNGSLTDISGLSNLTYAPRLELDSPEQYLTVMDASSPFCQAVATQYIKVFIGETNNKIAMGYLCNNADDQDLWLNLFHTHNQLPTYTDISDWENNNGIGDLSDKGFTDNQLPASPMATTSVYDLLMDTNNISNVDFMSNVTSVRRTLNFSDNQINRITGLANITNYVNLYLQNNSISDVTPLDNIQTGLVNIDLSYNDLLRAPNLNNFTTLKNVILKNNINMSDISGLSTLRDVENLDLRNTNISDLSSIENINVVDNLYLDNPINYDPKRDYLTPFCDGIKNDIIFPYYNSNLIDIRDVCTNFPDDYLWLLFFRDNGQLTTYNDISEWETKDGVASVTSISLQNEDLPPNLIGVTTLYKLNLSGNFIQNVDFLSEVNTVRDTLNLSNNSLTDITGLTTLSSINNLYLQDNENLGDISSLNNIVSINDLNLSNTGRVDLTGLDSLITITGVFDIRNNPLTDLSFLNQITSANKIQIDNPDNYSKLDYYTNDICENINNGNVILFNNTERLSADRICSNAPSEFDWLAFLKVFDKSNAFANYYSLQEWLTTNTTASLSSLDLTNADIPDGEIGVVSLYRLNISENNLTNIDFMQSVEESRYSLDFSFNNIENVNGLQNLTTSTRDILLNNNNITDLTGLEKLEEVGDDYHQTVTLYGTNVHLYGNPGVRTSNIDFRNNQLTNVDGLSGLRDLTYTNLYISKNPSLTDITGLSNLNSITYKTDRHCNSWDYRARCDYTTFYHYYYLFVDSPEQYTEKPETNSTFCVNLKAGKIVSLRETDNVRMTPADLCNITDEWLKLFHSYDQIKWEVDPNVINTNNLTINLSNNGITNADLPAVDFSFSTPYDINFSENSLTDVNFMNPLTASRYLLELSNNNISDISGLSNLTSVRILNLSNNNLTNVDALYNLTSSEKRIWLNGNPNLTDITGISNIINTGTGAVVFDEVTQYAERPLVDSPFCQALISGDAKAEIYKASTGDLEPTNAYEVCDASEAWLQFLKDNGQATELTQLSELNNQTTPIILLDNAFTNEDLPVGALNIGSLLNFEIANNQLTTIRFLIGLQDVNGNLNFSNNQLGDIEGLNDVIDIDGSLLINDNQLVNLNELSNLTRVGADLDISSNANLIDISKIENINTVLGTVYVDEPIQYKTKPDVSSDFCTAVANDSIYIQVKTTSRVIDVNEICSTTDEWLAYFHENDVLFDNLTLEDWNTNNLTIDISNNNLSDTDIPQSNIDLTEVYNFNISENNLTNIDFMSNITTLNNFSAENNELENINGLSSLTDINEELNIQGNINLTDITGLANITSGIIVVNNETQYANKPNVSTPFCVAVLNSTVSTGDLEEGEAALKVGQVCSSTNPWMTYFYDNNQMLEYAYITDMETNNIVIDLSNQSITDSSLPNELWNVLSIYDVNLKGNALTQINFLAGVNNIRKSLDLSLNNLNNLNGLFSLTTAGDLFLNGNNLTDISGLINLSQSTGFLYLSGNPNLTDISYLENLQTNNPAYPMYLDDPSQYTKKPALGSNFCLAVDSGSLTVINADTGSNITSSEICQ
tara:strand:- start:2797 stop:15378 length:12582 start_codon:yes stop_codon:yes gene_type:complete